MVLKFRDKNISSLDDIQKLTAKNLREILKSHVESAGGTNADNFSFKSLRIADARRHSIGQQRGERTSTSSRGTERQQFLI